MTQVDIDITDEDLGQLVLPANLETVRFIRVGVGYWEYINHILATLPAINRLDEIEVELQGVEYYEFEEIAEWLTRLDEQLQHDYYANVKRICLGIGKLPDGKSVEDYMRAMPHASLRNILRGYYAAH